MKRSKLHELTAATEANDAEAVARLLKEDRALVNCKDETPPPLHWAIYKDRPRIVEMLLDYGADIESRDQDNDTTPIRYAVLYGVARSYERRCRRLSRVRRPPLP